jgi:hypothetical protein
MVTGPKGAAIDRETGVFTWRASKGLRTEYVTIRVRDTEKPEITAEASFAITTATTISRGAIRSPDPALPNKVPGAPRSD